MDIESAILDAGRVCILRDGIQRTTMAGVAREAGVSRPTLYRRFSGVDELLGDLLTRELVSVLDLAYPLPETLDEVINVILDCTEAVRTNELLQAMVQSDPEILSKYVVQRFGRTQQRLMRFLAALFRNLEGEIREGDPDKMAAIVLVSTQILSLSGNALLQMNPEPNVWRRELEYLIRGYLTPSVQDQLELFETNISEESVQ
ncbi:TetR/AcrR family transcriptional regulator [Corynebacterium freiburgense]|uniref:TetR/AcrR family transcriptional regulator n=1 Tax=Corynebacterium freiburgense TaxID=556548 RepID=UPI00040C51E6|nr:TetR/AcrR family transcriptional regulator [Corynebacterium freiburgense]WJZ03669.1 Transcriptional regulator, TetR family [Corynebacterium freiburgense]